MSLTNSKELQRINYQRVRIKILPQVKNGIIRETTNSVKNLLENNKVKGYLGIYWPLNDEIDIRHLKTTLNWGLCSALGAILLGIMLILYWLYNKIVGIDNIKLG